MKLFSFDSNADGFKVRSALIDGEPWFVLADLCQSIGHSHPHKAKLALDREDWKTIAATEGLTRNQIPGQSSPAATMTLRNCSGQSSASATLTPNSRRGQNTRGGARSHVWVNESGLYTLILRSDKPAAKKFRRWVTAEVLPALRKQGFYSIIPEPNEVVTARQTALLTGQLGRIRTSVEALEKPPFYGWGTMGECLASLGIEMPETPAARLKLSRRIRGLAKERGIQPKHRWSFRQCRAAATWPRELIEAAAGDLPPPEQGQLPI